MAYQSQSWVDGSAGNTPLSAARMGHVESGLVDHETRIARAETAGGTALLDSFGGASDDAKLTAALAYASAQTYHPTILLTNQAYVFSLSRQSFDGLRLRGAWGYSNAEKSAANMACQVTCNGGGVWLSPPSGATQWDVSISQISFKGSSTTQWMGGAFYCMLLRDLSFSGFKSVLGSQTTKMLITAAQFDGWWEVNNSYNGAIHIGGSDNTLWPAGMLLDSDTAFNNAGNAAGQAHLWCDYLEKTSIGPLYITAEGGWSAVRVSGPALNTGGLSNLGGPLWITGARIEGRNAGNSTNAAGPCSGALVRVDGGMLTLRDCWISYGMAAPATTDVGVMQVSSGRLTVRDGTYDHGLNVAEAVPWITATGGDARVSGASTGSKGGVWTGLPRTHSAGGTITADNTVTAV